LAAYYKFLALAKFIRKFFLGFSYPQSLRSGIINFDEHMIPPLVLTFQKYLEKKEQKCKNKEYETK
jgi:hypothetical protein